MKIEISLEWIFLSHIPSSMFLNSLNVNFYCLQTSHQNFSSKLICELFVLSRKFDDSFFSTAYLFTQKIILKHSIIKEMNFETKWSSATFFQFSKWILSDNVPFRDCFTALLRLCRLSYLIYCINLVLLSLEMCFFFWCLVTVLRYTDIHVCVVLHCIRWLLQLLDILKAVAGFCQNISVQVIF